MIDIGDTVIVVKPTLCCGRTDAVGRTFVVDEMRTADIQCCYCHATSLSVTIAVTDATGGYNIERLQKLRPSSGRTTRAVDTPVPEVV